MELDSGAVTIFKHKVHKGNEGKNVDLRALRG